MARSTAYWKQLLVTEKQKYSALDGLNTSSITSIWGLVFYVIATISNKLDSLFDDHKMEIQTILATDKAHRLAEYRQMALEFQFGRSLMSDGNYDNTGFTDEEIADSKIISQAAATETNIDGIQVIRIKVVTGSTIWTQLSDVQLRAFSAYMERKKDGGVKVECTSQTPDNLKLNIDVWYDPTILTNDGKRVDGANDNSVQDAIRSYLQNLEFNGEYANVRLMDTLQKIDGVVLPEVKLSQYKYGLFDWINIDGRVIPDSGFFTIQDTDLTINWREYDS